MTKHASEGSTQALKPGGNVTRTGVSVRGPTKRLMSSQIFLKTNFTKIQKGYFLILPKVRFEKMCFPKTYVQELPPEAEIILRKTQINIGTDCMKM